MDVEDKMDLWMRINVSHVLSTQRLHKRSTQKTFFVEVTHPNQDDRLLSSMRGRDLRTFTEIEK